MQSSHQSPKRTRPRLVITPGDPDGIGPEIFSALYKSGRIPAACDWIVVGSQDALVRNGAHLPLQGSVSIVPAPKQAPQNKFLSGYQTGWSIERAARMILTEKAASGLVTGPISKERLQKGGYAFSGHTDFLAALAKNPGKNFFGIKPPSGVPITMMLANSQLRVSLVTVHVALERVSKLITKAELKRTIVQTVDALRNWWGISRPTLAVLGLNPHAGEGGLFGKQERNILEPLLKSLKNIQATLIGPLPADTVFAQIKLCRLKVDAVVCMYHDQGLIPVKLLDFPRTINMTLGLPFVRTSVDHGTAFDIAGKGLADPSSMEAALHEAARIALR